MSGTFWVHEVCQSEEVCRWHLGTAAQDAGKLVSSSGFKVYSSDQGGVVRESGALFSFFHDFKYGFLRLIFRERGKEREKHQFIVPLIDA